MDLRLKRVWTLSVLCFVFLALASCSDDKFEDYEGIWEGTYEGTDEGTWKFYIDEDGNVEGSATPDSVELGAFAWNGSVNEDGELTVTATVFDRDVTYDAFLTETNLDGSWQDEANSRRGNWTGTKRIKEDRIPYGLILNP